MISIIIPYHNEGEEFIKATLDTLEKTIDVKEYEVIIVDDCSNKPLQLDRHTVIRHQKNKGVGAAFDTGVSYARYDRLFLMGSDVRFDDNNWASKMIEEIDKHPKALLATTCVGINKDNMNIKERVNLSRNGATILIFHDHKSHPKKPENFRNILEAKWLSSDRNRKESYEIPCILGAAYGCSKEWYKYIDGFAGHRNWGTLEPYISLKSWLFGGSCMLTPHIYTAHIFKPGGTHNTPLHRLIYNKLFVASVLFDMHDRSRLINFLGTNPQVEAAKREYFDSLDYIKTKREEYEKKIVLDIRDYCKRWNIDFRDED